MKGLNRNVKKLSLYVILLGISGCLLKQPDNFIEQDFMLVKPFNKEDTVIFTSAKGQVDTIVFSPSKIITGKQRNFELGFYNYQAMLVEYNLTQGSYHVVTLPKNDQSLYVVRSKLYGVVTSSDGNKNNNREFSFLGLWFDDDFIKAITVDTSNIIDFKAKDSNKRNKIIFDFKFSPRIGIISYVDTGRVKWSRSRE